MQAFLDSDYADEETKKYRNDETVIWTNGIFHKNDGYSFPIVINPYRYKGVFDQKKEFQLTNYRLMSLLIAAKNKNKERKAGERGNFQLDHAYPKSRYPWLCTTFFNMVPSCGSYNLAKHADAPLYNFYTNDYAKLYPFHFRLEAKSLLRYLLTQDEKNLKIKLDTKEAGLDNYEQAFSIESLYSAYNDVVEEIIWKARIYNESFKANLEESLGRLFPYCGDFTRFIVGNYTEPRDILKRPLALLMGDIARQLKLI